MEVDSSVLSYRIRYSAVGTHRAQKCHAMDHPANARARPADAIASSLSQQKRLAEKVLLGGVKATYTCTELKLQVGTKHVVFTRNLGRTSGSYAAVVTPHILAEQLMKAQRLQADLTVVGCYRKYADIGGLLSLRTEKISRSKSSRLYGTYVSFQADDFSMSVSSQGALTVILTGDSWRTSGSAQIFLPATAPANFGKTLDDVVVTVDGQSVTATTSDHSNAGQNGRLWSLTVTYSTHTLKADPNPAPTHGAPVGGEMLPIDALRVLSPWLAVVAVLGVVSAGALIAKRKSAH